MATRRSEFAREGGSMMRSRSRAACALWQRIIQRRSQQPRCSRRPHRRAARHRDLEVCAVRDPARLRLKCSERARADSPCFKCRAFTQPATEMMEARFGCALALRCPPPALGARSMGETSRRGVARWGPRVLRGDTWARAGLQAERGGEAPHRRARRTPPESHGEGGERERGDGISPLRNPGRDILNSTKSGSGLHPLSPPAS